MTKSSRQKRRKGIYVPIRWKYYARHGKAKGTTCVLQRRRMVLSNHNVRPFQKSKGSIGPLKQLNIIKKEQKVLSTLQFKDLPNEVIYHVFRYLKIVDLLKCGQVSKRLRAISIDLWPKKLNLCCKKVPVGLLQKLLDNGCKYLSLSEAILEGNLNLSKASRLQYLNLSGFGLNCNKENSEKLLESCYSLQKLSLSKFPFSSKLINSISLQHGKTLKVLDLSGCTFSRTDNNLSYLHFHRQYTAHIQQIAENCTGLKELSLSRIKLPEKAIDILVSNLTSNIEKLDLFDLSDLGDKHIKTLVTRCNKIIELNLGGGTSVTKNSLNYIIEHLQWTLVKLNYEFTEVRFYLSDLLELKTMKKLELLCYQYLCCDDLIRMKNLMPNLQINSEFGGNTRIAGACDYKYIGNGEGFWIFNAEREEQGFWEIKAEREELFTDNFSSQYIKHFK